MPVTVVLGMQFGDEGKGKIVDFLAKDANAVARFQGGNNAGHTIIHGSNKYVFHLIPSGILQKKECFLGNGMVINPEAFLEEVNVLRNQGIDVEKYIKIAPNAHIITKDCISRDNQQEKTRTEKIGTTGKGIGPTYSDKINRCGIRAFEYTNPEFQKFVDPLFFMNVNIAASKKHLLVEGAQGALLDIDHGTYPYVTSSSCTIGGVCTGLGIPPQKIQRIVGVMKTYTTRVGQGPFLTKITNSVLHNHIATLGHEIGATTGRPRDCGWLDIPALKYAIKLNGVTELALTKLDIVNQLKEVRVCKNYETGPVNHRYYLSSYNLARFHLNKMTPRYKIFTMNNDPILSKTNKAFVIYLKKALEVSIKIISTGPDINQTICL